MSYRSRIAIAVALTVGFYLLALVVGVGLIAAPVVGYAVFDTGNVWVAIALIGAGIGVLRELVPERQAFTPPGPELTRQGHPRLFALLDRTATAAGDRTPDAVYLELDANASVTATGRTRVMTLGLPLLAALDVDELRAVVAHEHGHFVGGDLRAGRLVWRTRATAIRTMVSLRESDRWFRANVAYWPFRGYTILLLRVSNAVNRRQEFAADALAADVTSPEVMGRALRRVNGVAAAWADFWARDAAPMLEAGRRPPLADGFTAMLAHTDVATALDAISTPDAIAGDPDPYASHPTLGARLEALGLQLEGGMPDPAPRPALGLLDEGPALERRLLRACFGAQTDTLEAADWTASGEVHLDRIRSAAAPYTSVWPGRTVADAGTLATQLAVVRDVVAEQVDPDRTAPPLALDDAALSGLGCLVAVVAAGAGLTVTAEPGAAVLVHADGAELAPFGLLHEIRDGERPVGAWAAHPVVTAMGDRLLGSGVPAPRPAAA